MISLASMSLATLPFLAGLIPLVGGDLLWLSLAGPARPALSHHHPCNAVVAVKHCSPGLPQQHPTFFFFGEGGPMWMNLISFVSPTNHTTGQRFSL